MVCSWTSLALSMKAKRRSGNTTRNDTCSIAPALHNTQGVIARPHAFRPSRDNPAQCCHVFVGQFLRLAQKCLKMSWALQAIFQSSKMADFNPSLIAAVDIGSPMTGKLGWAVLPDEKIGKDVQTLVALVAKALLGGPVALGFEAPLWVPMRMDEMLLTKARRGAVLVS